MADGTVGLGFEVISVKQMSTARRSPEGTTSINLPLFLLSLPRTTKSHNLVKLSNLCHIYIKVEAYKEHTALTQCYKSTTIVFHILEHVRTKMSWNQFKHLQVGGEGGFKAWPQISYHPESKLIRG
jgi:hypothetical protein